MPLPRSDSPTLRSPSLETRAGARNRFLTGLRRLMGSWFGALLGGSVYGAWATWANRDQGRDHALLIGASHWATSALLTYCGTWAMGQFFGQSKGWRGAARAFTGGLALTYACLLTVHTLLRTEHVLLTLAPGLIPNIIFCSSYAALLMRTTTSTQT